MNEHRTIESNTWRMKKAPTPPSSLLRSSSMGSRKERVAEQVSSVANSIRKSFSGDELTWAELQVLERRRRAVLKNTSLPFWKILMHWDGTCLRILATDPLMWISMSIYAAIRIQSRYGLPDFVSDISTSDIGVIGGFLSFFLVFFVVTANTRFDNMYQHSMDVEKGIFDLTCLAKSTLSKAAAQRMNRYTNAAHVCAYVALSDTYTSTNFFPTLNEEHRMLTESEVQRLQMIGMDFDGSCYREILAWVMQEVEVAFKSGVIDPRLASLYREKVLVMRDSIDALFHFADQPISFFYLHFLSLLSALYLPLFAVSAAYEAGTGSEVYWTADVLSGLIVFLQVIFVIGLRLLGQKLMDPYGSDLEDLSVMHYVQFTWISSNRILQASLPKEVDPEEEEQLARSRVSLGLAFGGKTEVDPDMLT